MARDARAKEAVGWHRASRASIFARTHTPRRRARDRRICETPDDEGLRTGLRRKAKKYASNAAFTIHNAKLKPFVQNSLPLGRILGWDTHYDSDGYYGGFW